MIDKWGFSSRELATAGILLVLAAVAPLIIGRYYLSILTSIMILSVFAVAFNLAFGFADLPSFGHAAFFGLGAYGLALTAEVYPDTLLLPIVVAIVATIVFSVIVGFFSTRGKGIYFALLTFAFAQFLYEVVIRTPEYTGATDGVFVTPPRVFGVDLSDQTVMYYVSIIVLIVVLIVIYRIINSPFGNVLEGLRNNEGRTKALGYPVRKVKILAFSISAALASFSGILFGLNNSYVSPNTLFFLTSLDAFLMAVIGGASTLTGPIAGAGFLILVRTGTRGFANIGILTTGIIFVVIIMYLPDGIIGTLKQRYFE